MICSRGVKATMFIAGAPPPLFWEKILRISVPGGVVFYHPCDKEIHMAPHPFADEVQAKNTSTHPNPMRILDARLSNVDGSNASSDS